MVLRNTAEEFGTLAKALHWFVAAGLFSILLPVAESRDSHEFWEEIHEFAWKIVAALIVVHILGAIYNHFIAKNDVLRRMTLGTRKP